MNNYKKITLVNIIIWSIVILVAIVVLIMAWAGFSGIGSSKENVIKEHIVTETINSIEISWTSGDLHILKSDDDNIKIIEDTPENRKSDIRVSGDKLHIKERQKNQWFVFNFGNYNRNVKVYLPDKLYNEIEIDSASGDMDLSNLKVDDLDITLVSGNANLNGLESKKVSIDLISGKVKGDNVKTDESEINTVSGNIEIGFSNMPKEIEFDTVSGKIDITIPENDGFTVKVDKVSGSFSSNFELSNEGQRYTYKNGQSRFSVDLVSGKVIINRG